MADTGTNLAEKAVELAEFVKHHRGVGDYVYRWRVVGLLTARGDLVDRDGRRLRQDVWWAVIAATWRGQAWLNGTAIGHTHFPHDTTYWARAEINMVARKYRTPARVADRKAQPSVLDLLEVERDG